MSYLFDEQVPVFDGPMSKFLNSPGMAMAGSALNNMMAMRRGHAPQSNPFQVLQEQQRRNAYLQQQRMEMIQRREARKEQAEIQQQRLELQKQQQIIANTKPNMFKSGNNVVAVHPLTGQSKVVFEGPEDWQVHGDTSTGFWRISPTTGNQERLTGPLSESGYFKGTSMQSQMFNKLLQQVDPERREAVAVELITQTLGRPTTYTTADGVSHTQPGIDVQGALGGAVAGSEMVAPEPTQAEREAYGYFTRMEDAEKRIQEVFSKYPDFDPAGDLKDYSSGKLSDFLGTDTFKSEPWQLFDSAVNDWVGAKLRKESGAVIGEEEKAQEIGRYFPRFGSSKAKRVDLDRARMKALFAMARSSGRAIDEHSGSPFVFVPSVGIVMEEDIKHTMETHNMTREQVLESLGVSDAP
ncbi:hypothetical protein E2F43_10790 [Seongchinamella unica]|uniref:Uncharacterized protein n=1 Tax=Seongchinamella unica TaxID=2547392 RepID=A0A4R5LSS1_9GAMM|nr:hypothetical protein [Seongchinamella unica]TDG13972.1 hypothetical protein E2F43_10790 [Seongchinamella unica]